MVIPVFNNRPTIERAVRSALDQESDVEVEVVVADDGSADGSAEAAARTDPDRVTVVRQQNAGPGAARNAGARAARATRLVFLDADDELLPGAVERFHRAHGPDTPLVRAGAVRTTRAGAVTVMAEPHPLPYPRGTPLAGTFSIDRDLFEAIGGYDPEFRFGENSELLTRARMELDRRGARCAFMGQPTVRVHENAGRGADHYLMPRLAAIERMLAVHAAALAEDRRTLHDHHAIAANLHRTAGNTRAAVRHAWAAVRCEPVSARDWARLARTLLPHRAGRGLRR